MFFIFFIFFPRSFFTAAPRGVRRKGLSVRFYPRENENGHVGVRAVLCWAWDLAVLGALGWVGRGVWLWWARCGSGFGFLCVVFIFSWCVCVYPHGYPKCVSWGLSKTKPGMFFMDWASQKKPKNKVVVSVVWFNSFTCAVWGLCWYHSFCSFKLWKNVNLICGHLIKVIRVIWSHLWWVFVIFWDGTMAISKSNHLSVIHKWHQKYDMEPRGDACLLLDQMSTNMLRPNVFSNFARAGGSSFFYLKGVARIWGVFGERTKANRWDPNLRLQCSD